MEKVATGEASRAASGYKYQPTAGREEVLAAYDNLIEVLRKRAALHDEHGNRDLREMALRFAQRALLEGEKLAQKWVESDARGLTY